MKNEHFEGRGVTLNSLLEEREALNMRMLLGREWFKNGKQEKSGQGSELIAFF